MVAQQLNTVGEQLKETIFVFSVRLMQILFINSLRKNRWGGGEKWMVEAASGLNLKGHRSIIGCKNGSIIQKKARQKEVSTVNFAIHSDIDFLAMFRLQKLLIQLRIDVLVCCQNKDVKIGGRAGRRVKTGAIFSRQGLQLFTNKKRYRYPFTQLIDGIITNTQSIKNTYASFGWFGPNFIHVVYNGMTLPELNAANTKKKVFGIDDDHKVVFSAGRLSLQKGYDYLIDAAAMCKERGKNYRFFIAGQGKLEEYLKKKIKQLKLEEYVILMGFIEQPGPYYQAADIFVLPSLFEGMPNVVMESMAHGTPAILTRVNGAEELVDHGVNSIIIEPKKPAMIYDALETYFSDKTDRAMMAKRARDKVNEQFTTEVMATKLEGLFIQQLSKNK